MTEPVVATPPVVTPPVVTPPVVTPPAAVTPPVTPAPEATLLTPPPAPVGAPEKYELKLPENPALEATSLVEIEAFSKAQGLTQEKAQELVNFQNKWAADRATAEAAALEKQTKEWLAEIKSDKDLMRSLIRAQEDLAAGRLHSSLWQTLMMKLRGQGSFQRRGGTTEVIAS